MNKSTVKRILIICFAILALQNIYAKEEILINENFDDNKNEWLVGQSQTINALISDGKYVIKGHTGHINLAWSTLHKGFSNEKDFTIKCRAKWLANKNPMLYRLFGITWGTTNNQYFFGISPTKGAGTIKLYFGELQKVVKIKRHSFIDKKGDNQLEVRKRGERLIFLVNGEKIGEEKVSNDVYINEKTGLFVTGNQKVVFDNFKLTGHPAEIPERVANNSSNVSINEANPNYNSPPKTSSNSSLSFDGLWLVNAEELGDFGLRTSWMSEWTIKGRRLKIHPKNMITSNCFGGVCDWEITKQTIRDGQFELTVVNRTMMGKDEIAIQGNIEEKMMRGSYSRVKNTGGLIQRSNGNIEMRPLPNYTWVLGDFDAQSLIGNYIVQGEQRGDQIPLTSFTQKVKISENNNMLVVTIYNNNDGIKQQVTRFITSIIKTPEGIKMTAYDPDSSCANCGDLFDYDLIKNSMGYWTGDFEGVSSSIGIMNKMTGTITFVKQ